MSLASPMLPAPEAGGFVELFLAFGRFTEKMHKLSSGPEFDP
jgi:hypothetical protein